MLEFLNQQADYLSLHLYVQNTANNFADFMASSIELDQRTKTAEGIIDAALSGQPPVAGFISRGTSGMSGIAPAAIRSVAGAFSKSTTI
ncbi:MAG: hypothetical protein WDO73_13600 [Ignavibacteriota bacterium]